MPGSRPKPLACKALIGECIRISDSSTFTEAGSGRKHDNNRALTPGLGQFGKSPDYGGHQLRGARGDDPRNMNPSVVCRPPRHQHISYNEPHELTAGPSAIGELRIAFHARHAVAANLVICRLRERAFNHCAPAQSLGSMPIRLCASEPPKTANNRHAAIDD